MIKEKKLEVIRYIYAYGFATTKVLAKHLDSNIIQVNTWLNFYVKKNCLQIKASKNDRNMPINVYSLTDKGKKYAYAIEEFYKLLESI